MSIKQRAKELNDAFKTTSEAGFTFAGTATPPEEEGDKSDAE